MDMQDRLDLQVTRDMSWEGAWEATTMVLLIEAAAPTTPEDVGECLRKIVEQARAANQAELNSTETALQRAIQHVKKIEADNRHLGHLLRLSKKANKGLRTAAKKKGKR